MFKFLSAIVVVWAISSPAWAEPVELVCEGTMVFFNSKGSPEIPQRGVHLLIEERTVAVTGNAYFKGTYSIYDADAAEIRFRSEDSAGFVNRFSGEFVLTAYSSDGWEDPAVNLNATCGKPNPLF